MVHETLMERFDAKPLSSISKSICWRYGDRDQARQLKGIGDHEGRILFGLENNRSSYGNGTTHMIHAINAGSRFRRGVSEALTPD